MSGYLEESLVISRPGSHRYQSVLSPTGDGSVSGDGFCIRRYVVRGMWYVVVLLITVAGSLFLKTPRNYY